MAVKRVSSDTREYKKTTSRLTEVGPAAALGGLLGEGQAGLAERSDSDSAGEDDTEDMPETGEEHD